MRLDASGNLGLGTSAPSGSGWDESSTVLHIYKNAINGGLLKLESSNTTAILNAGNDQLAIFTTTNDPIRFGTNGSERMRLDTSGNLGLGVTPSAWDRPAYQSTQNLALLGLSNTSNLAQNAYYNAGWKYITTAAAADFQVAQGAFYWFNAPSGTAGNAISFTQAMTLDASGNLLLGGTTGNDRLVINDSKSSTSQYTSTGFVTISNSDQTNNNWSTIAFTDGPTQAFSTAIQTKYTDHTNNYGELHFSTRSSAGLTTKLMIAEGGNVGINNTTPSYKLTIQANGATESALGFIDVNTNGRTWLIGPGVGTGSSADFGFYNNTASQLASLFTTGTSAKWAWYTGGSERMRLDASGNLGLGNSAPSYKFDILGSSTNGIGQIIKNSNSNSYFTIDVYGTNGFGVTNWPYSAVLESVPQSTGGLVLSAYSNGIYFQTGARQTRMTLDASGNLGLGVTPSAWTGTGVKAFQFQNGSLAASSSFGTWLSWNAYYDGSDKYVSSSTAGRYLIEGNVHRWDIAPSGTAGNAISFTQAMTLFSTGNLSVGGTSDTGEKLQITGRAVINANSGALNADILTVRGGGSSGNYGFKVEANNGADLFYTDNYTYNVIMGTTGGLVGIGTTSPTSKLHIVATSSNNALRLDSDVSGTYTILEFANAGTTKSQIYNDLSGGDMVMRTTTSANLIFGTNSSERMRITSGGNVGIGTSSPAVKLDVIEGGTPAAASAGTVARFVTAGGSGYDALIGIVGGTGGRSMIDLGDTGSSSIGRLGYDHTADFMFFQTNGSERMRIASDGNVGIGGNVGAPDAKLTISNNSAEGIEFAVALFSNLNRILSYNRNTSVYNTLRFDGLDNQFYTQGIEKMRLTSSGELLINTTSDAGDYKLQVNGNVYATGIGYINGGVVGNSSNNLYLSSNSSGGEISFWANQLNTRLMTILGGGDVGIGVSSPSAKLEVNGAIKTAAPSGGTAKPWKLGEAGVTLGGSNTSGVRVEIDGVVYYLVTGYLP
jgi:hypothetical protein